MSATYSLEGTRSDRERRRLGRAVRRILAVVGLARVMQFVEAVLFPLVAVERGAGAAGGATVLLSLALGSTAGSLVSGSAVDRWGARWIATAGLSTAALAAAALAAADGLELLAAAAALYGFASATWRLALEAAISQGLAEDGPSAAGGDAGSRERAFGAFVWLVNLGALVSAGALAAGTGLRAAVAAQAATTAAAALAAAVLLPGTRATPSRGREAPGLRDVPVRMWLLAMAFAPLTMVMFQAFAGLAEVLDPRDYRTMVLINALVLVAFPPALWALATRVDGVSAIAAAGVAQGAGMAVAAITKDALLATVVWSAGEATLIAVMPAVVAGIAPHRAAGSYRAAFATVQGGSAALATFAGPLVARSSVAAFALGCLLLTGAGVAALGAHRRFIDAGLRQPVACPCGALLCSCDAEHIACAYPSPIVVHGAQPATSGKASGGARPGGRRESARD